jgi:hypothetical protein
MVPVRPHRSLVPGLVLVLCALAAGGAQARAPYAEGEEIEITGTVTNEAGQAVDGATVALEASRRAWRFRAANVEEKGRTVVDTARREATSGPGGRYTIPWRWHDYYNRFDLVVGRTVATTSGPQFQEIERIDLDRRIRQGSPVVTSFIIPSAKGPSRPAATAPPTASDRVEARFSDAVRSADERRVFADQGRPDRVEVLDHADYQEVTWWYFRAGKAYRFQDGELAQVVPFDPVEPF